MGLNTWCGLLKVVDSLDVNLFERALLHRACQSSAARRTYCRKTLPRNEKKTFFAADRDPSALPVRVDIVPNLRIYGDFRLKPPFRVCNRGPAEPPYQETGSDAGKICPRCLTVAEILPILALARANSGRRPVLEFLLARTPISYSWRTIK